MSNHIVDSGAHSWINLLYKSRKGRGGKIDWSIYKTKEFWKYVDDYAEFIKQHRRSIDHYITVDVIRNPKLTWKVQKYMEEEHGLNPIPVVHFNTEIKWLAKYIEAGYRYIGMGGRLGKQPYTPWADRCFNFICSTQDRLPCVKIHGFSITTPRLMARYPWYSVDSVTWKKPSYQGQFVVPFKVNGEFDPIKSKMIFIDDQSPYTKRGEGKGRHFLHYPKSVQNSIREWLERMEVPFGERSRDGSIISLGVSNDPHYRCQATIRYFEWMKKHLPKWPWPFQANERPSLLEAFGLEESVSSQFKPRKVKSRTLIIYYAGCKPETKAHPWDDCRVAAEKDLNVMTTYWENRGRMGKRKRKFWKDLRKRHKRTGNEFRFRGKTKKA